MRNENKTVETNQQALKFRRTELFLLNAVQKLRTKPQKTMISKNTKKTQTKASDSLRSQTAKKENKKIKKGIDMKAQESKKQCEMKRKQ